MSTTTEYRIEERRTSDGQVISSVATFDGDPLTAASGWEVLHRVAARHPDRFAPHGGYRLVLVGPNHTRVPAKTARRWGWRR